MAFEMIDDALLTRHLSGECSLEEQVAVRRWLDADAANQARFDQLRTAWEQSGDRATPVFDIASMRRRLARQRIEGRRPLWAAGGRNWLIPAAAAAAAAAVTFVAVSPSTRSKPPVTDQREVSTARGQRADVYLSDGTRVLLAPESRLRFTSPLGEGAREVALEGRAMFEVKHDSLRPFRVHARGGVAEDLGTVFDVEQYPADTLLRVLVAEGLVALERSGEPASRVELVPGDDATLAPTGPAVVRRAVNATRALEWTRGRLTFAAVPLRDAVRELRRYYDFEFIIADSATGARRLTASFTDEPPSEVVGIIAMTLGVRQTTRGKTVTFALRPGAR